MNWMPIVVLAAGLLSAPLVQAARAQNAAAPSFDCARAKGAVETTICRDRALAEADALMARLYPLAQVSAVGRGPSNQAATQRKWLIERGECRANAECLKLMYDDRIHALAVAMLFTNRELALQTLRRVDPDAAPLYEAIALYAEGAPAERLGPLIAPYFGSSSANERRALGASALESEKIRTPADALKSDKNFARFLQLTSAYLDHIQMPPALPCGAILRRPGLIDATDPYFGSSMDNGIFSADCRDTLPPLPRFDALVHKITSTWPDCDGTIQYAFYRSYAVAETAARAATKAQIVAFAPLRDARRPKPLPRLTGVPPAMADAAIAELAAFYQRYQGVSAAAGRAYARSAVHDLLGAGHECG